MDKLKEQIKTVCKTGNFTLTSGKKSDFYIDIKSLLLKPEFLEKIGKLIYKHIKNLNKDVFAVGGMELGSVPISTATCITSVKYTHPLNQFIIRKTKRNHGTTSQVEGWDSIANKNIVLVDDVITTGGSLHKMVDVISDHAHIVAIIVLVDREDLGVGNYLKNISNIPVISLFKKNELV